MNNIEKRLIIAKTQLILSNPILGSLVIKMDIQEDQQSELPMGAKMLMGVDVANNRLFYNAKNMEGVPDNLLQFIMAHEAMHVLNGTLLRKNGRDHFLWNIATDFEINWMLQDMEFKTTDFPGLLYDKNIHDKNIIAEEIYEMLLKNAKKVAGKKGPGSEDMESFDTVKDTSSCDEERKARINQQSAMVSANQLAKDETLGKGIGKFPDSLRRIIDKFTTSKVSWKDYFSAYITGISQDDFSYRRCSPGFIPQNIYLPTLYSPTTKAFIIVDTSGSIGTRELRLFLSEIKEMLWMFEISFMSCDADVGGIAENAGTIEEILEALKGGGGTIFAPAFKWLEENIHDETNVVLMTDGDNGDEHIERPGVVRNLIVLTTTGRAPAGIEADVLLHVTPDEGEGE